MFILSRIYVYGIIDSNKKVSSTVKGLGKAGVYNMPYRDIGAVVSNFNGEIRYGIKENVLKHEGVMEKLMSNFTILPMRFGTMFNKKEDVLFIMKQRYKDFKQNLTRLRNKVEFGIKVLWSCDRVKKKINTNFDKERKISIPGNTKAKNYIREKFKSYSVDREVKKEADECIRQIDGYFYKIVIEKKLLRLQSEKLLLNAYYLIDRAKHAEFKKAFDKLKRTYKEFEYLISGPWPPYNFCETQTYGAKRT